MSTAMSGRSVDDVVPADVLEPQHLPPAEREQLAGELGGALGRFPALLEVAPRHMIRRQLRGRHVGVAADGGEQVVQLVRDPTRKPDDRVHLVALLRAAPLGGVEQHTVPDGGTV
jgi:hypothetical protein